MLHVTGTAFLSSGSTWTPSDIRVKENIETIEDPYSKIMAVRPVTFTFKKDWSEHMRIPDGLKTGYIAQEYQEVFPEDVQDGQEWEGETLLDLSANAVGPYTTAAVQQLIRDNAKQQQTIDDMRRVITSQEDRLLKLEKMMKK
jgi:hypothetical protein